MFPFYAFVVLRTSLQAMFRIRAIVLTVLAANVVNVSLNWILVFGNLGAPPLGATGLLMGLMGTVAVASHQVALQLAAMTFMVPAGVVQATGVVVGQAVGRGDQHGARRAVGAGLITVTAFYRIGTCATQSYG